MYTICTREEWRDDFFDIHYCVSEYGTFGSYDEARRKADKIDGVVIQIEE